MIQKKVRTCQNNMYPYARIDNLDILTEARKEQPPQGNDASTAEAAPGRVGRDEQGEAHRANTTRRMVDLISS